LLGLTRAAIEAVGDAGEVDGVRAMRRGDDLRLVPLQASVDGCQCRLAMRL